MPIKRTMTCWVIPNGKGEPWPIDEDDTKPVYLKDGLPHYADGELFNYHLANKPGEEVELTQDDPDYQFRLEDYETQ